MSRTNRRLSRANWWFERMRPIVDKAINTVNENQPNTASELTIANKVGFYVGKVIAQCYDKDRPKIMDMAMKVGDELKALCDPIEQQLREQITELRTEVERLKTNSEHLSTEITALNSLRLESVKKLERLKGELAAERAGTLALINSSERVSMAAELREAQKENEHLRRQAEELNAEVKLLQMERSEYKTQLSSLGGKLTASELARVEMREALEKVKTHGHLCDHRHWDDTMQHGRGCLLCIDQHIASDAVHKALSQHTPSNYVHKDEVLKARINEVANQPCRYFEDFGVLCNAHLQCPRCKRLEELRRSIKA